MSGRLSTIFPGEHRSLGFLALNPLGKLPVLEDGALVLPDAEAILCHLANRYDEAGTWLPRDPTRFGPVMMWLAFAGQELRPLSRARRVAMLSEDGDVDALRAEGRAALGIVEDHLTDAGRAGHNWLVGDAPTLADIAVFPAVALSHDYGIRHTDYPALNLWQRRVRQLPKFVSMPGIPDYF